MSESTFFKNVESVAFSKKKYGADAWRCVLLVFEHLRGPLLDVLHIATLL